MSKEFSSTTRTNTKLSIYVLCFILLLFVKENPVRCFKKSYTDTRRIIEHKLQFLNENCSTKEKVEFRYRKEKGVFCIARKNISSTEPFISINKEDLITSYSPFPFKKELKEILFDIAVQNQTPNKFKFVNTYLFAFHIMYQFYSKKYEIEDYLKKNKREKEITKISKLAHEYLRKSFQRVNFDIYSLSEEEIELKRFLRVDDSNVIKPPWIVLAQIKKLVTEKYPRYKSYILPWIDNLELLKFTLSNVVSRRFYFDYNIYKKLYSSSITKEEEQTNFQVKTQYWENTDFQNYWGLIPFLDSCNNFSLTKTQKRRYEKLGKNVTDMTFAFQINVSDDLTYLNVKLPNHSLEAGEEILLSYISGQERGISNIMLLQSYGYYLKDNVSKLLFFLLDANTQFFSREKHDICLELNCFHKGANYTHQYEKNAEVFNIEHFIPEDFNNDILNIFRLFFIHPRILQNNKHEVIHKLKNKIPLGFEIEMLANHHYLKFIRNFLDDYPSITDIIRIKQLTKNIYNSSNKFMDNPKMRYTYKLRRLITYHPYEEKQILLTAMKVHLKQSIKQIYKNIFQEYKNKVLK